MNKILFISKESLLIKMIKSFFTNKKIECSNVEKINDQIFNFTHVLIDLPYIDVSDNEQMNTLLKAKDYGTTLIFFKDSYDIEKMNVINDYGHIFDRDLQYLDKIYNILNEKKADLETDKPLKIDESQNIESEEVEKASILKENQTKETSKDNFTIEEDVKILIADDSNAIRNFVKKILISKGYQVQAFEDGKQLIDFLELGNTADLILLDNQMPNMNGVETLQYLKSKKEFSNYPVLFLSAIKEKDTVVQALELGADDYMEKPFHNNEFLARINVHVRMELLKRSIIEKNILIEKEKEKSDQLLLNTLPKKIVEDLKTDGKTYPETFENVSVYFSDIAGFTSQSSKLEPGVLINELNEIFTEFDNIMEQNSCERIKTIGDAYLAVCGMPIPNNNHAENMMQSAIQIIEYLKNRNETNNIKWKIRIGIHSGKVTGGIVGVKKYIYDVFGDTINTASRMESNSLPMEINVSPITYNLLKDNYEFIERAPVEVKGKGKMNMYFYASETIKEQILSDGHKKTDTKKSDQKKGLRDIAHNHMNDKSYRELYEMYHAKKYKKAIELIDTYKTKNLEARHYKLFGLIYYADNNYTEAAEFWKKSLDIDPDQKELIENLNTLMKYISEKALA